MGLTVQIEGGRRNGVNVRPRPAAGTIIPVDGRGEVFRLKYTGWDGVLSKFKKMGAFLVYHKLSPEFNPIWRAMLKAQPDYLSFLLRLYRVRGEPGVQPTPTETIWRVSLENPRTHERQGFASLEELFEFLREQVDEFAGQRKK